MTTSIKKKLHPKFWKNGKLSSEVRKHLLQVAKDFIAFTKVKNLKIRDIVFTGSLANYTYHDKSDIDLHIIFDLSNFERHRAFIKEYLQSKKAIWNENHDINIYGFKIEVYPEDETGESQSTGKYSLIKGEWIKTPSVPEKTEVDKQQVKLKYQDAVDQILDFEEQSSEENVDYKSLIKKMEKFVLNLRDARKEALKAHGDMAVENLAFKMLRNNGYFDRLRELKKTLYDKKLSLKECNVKAVCAPFELPTPKIRVYMLRGNSPSNAISWSAANNEEAEKIANLAKSKGINVQIIQEAAKTVDGQLIPVIEFPKNNYKEFHKIVKKLMKNPK